MTSDTHQPREAYVWIWLPGCTDPVVAGRLEAEGKRYLFNYGRSYLDRDDALPLYLPELPLERGQLAPPPPLIIANALRDAAPDAWGRRVVVNRLTGLTGRAASEVELDELTFLLESGSDRVGALDFQKSASHYEPRQSHTATLTDMAASAERVEQGLPLTPALALALQHGTAIGGARPKALIESEDKKYVAKFASSTDTLSVVKAEYIAMQLAAEAGINVAPVTLTSVLGKDILLVERFDRTLENEHWLRHSMVSALTLLELDELMAAHASYPELATIMRKRFTDVPKALHELFVRLTFNMLVGNTDDHARNHAAFWNGDQLTLTPAYDICPQARFGREASQGMLVNEADRRSQLAVAINAAHHFLLHRDDAVAVVRHQVQVIRERWDDVCREAELTEVDRNLMWRRQFLNPYAFEGLHGELRDLIIDLE